MDHASLHLMDLLEVLMPVGGTRQTRLARLAHEAELGINIGLLLLFRQGVPRADISRDQRGAGIIVTVRLTYQAFL